MTEEERREMGVNRLHSDHPFDVENPTGKQEVKIVEGGIRKIRILIPFVANKVAADRVVRSVDPCFRNTPYTWSPPLPGEQQTKDRTFDEDTEVVD